MTSFYDLIISPQENLKTALHRMTQNHRGILVVCDADRRLAGVLSDGDVRRALVDETLLISPISKAMNLDPIIATSPQQAADLLRARHLVAVPLVTAAGILAGICIEEADGIRILEPDEDLADTLAQGLGAVALIPARGGSKRIPRKNLAEVSGKPLLAWAILAAQTAQHVGHIVVSTDDAEIAQVAQHYGAPVPWMRPEPLARDTTPTLDVLLHAFAWSQESLMPRPDYAVLLEPTAPLRTATHIDAALEALHHSDADCVMSVSEVPHLFNPEELLAIEDGVVRPYLPGRTMDARRLRGQQQPAYLQNGLVYAVRIGAVLKNRSLYGAKVVPLVTPWSTVLDIDEPEDLVLANLKLRKL